MEVYELIMRRSSLTRVHWLSHRQVSSVAAAALLRSLRNKGQAPGCTYRWAHPQRSTTFPWLKPISHRRHGLKAPASTLWVSVWWPDISLWPIWWLKSVHFCNRYQSFFYHKTRFILLQNVSCSRLAHVVTWSLIGSPSHFSIYRSYAAYLSGEKTKTSVVVSNCLS